MWQTRVTAVTSGSVCAGGDLPFVSVILPVYNEMGYVGPCLESLLNNTYPANRYEILVIDGRSTDGTREYIEALARQDARVRLIDNPRRFLAPGINIGIREARGELLTRMDGHGVAAPDFIERSVEALREHPDAWCAGGPVNTVARSFIGQVIATAIRVPVGIGGPAYRTGNVEGYVPTVLQGTYRREVFERIGLLDENMIRTEDDDLHIRLHQAGGRIYITPKVRSDHYARESLSKVARQYYQYGYWRIPIILKYGKPATLRQVVPLAFVLSWLALVVAALLWRPALYALVGLVGVYLLVLLAGAIMAMRKHSFLVGLCTPAVFPLLHFGYGLGSLLAVLRFVVLRKPVAGDQGGTSLTR